MYSGVCEIAGEECYHPISCSERGCVKQRQKTNDAQSRYASVDDVERVAEALFDREKAVEHHVAIQTLDSEREANARLTDEVSALTSANNDLLEALRKIMRGEVEVFDDDLQTNVTVSMDMDEAMEIASSAFKKHGGTE